MDWRQARPRCHSQKVKVMRKLLISFSLILCCLSVMAKPAKPGYIKYKQPDGTTIQIMRHGDERASWTTDSRGQVIRKEADGFFREVRSMTPERAARVASVRRRALQEMQNRSRPRRVLLLLLDRSISC